ncbi:MAG: hypothetical protein KAU95_03400, partial [Candidatus Aenigmarchaeota archaeon]|nr:hypothetical protein [Candidatus Aenigmarchaeota archaeon]
IVGSKVYNLTFSGTPAENITINYIVVDETATTCDFNLTAYNTATVDGKKVCNISSNQIFLEGGESITPFSVLFWDNKMENDTPLNLSNTSEYYSTCEIDDYTRKINLTFNATNGTFTNATAWWQLNDSKIRGEEFLKVWWEEAWQDIAPENTTDNCNTSSPTYILKTLNATDKFYACKRKIGNNTYFKWKQPELSSQTNYTVGGFSNLPANLTNLTVSPNETIWGEIFNFSVDADDEDGNNISVALLVFYNNEWHRDGQKNATNGTNVEFNLTSNKNWTGINKFRFEYFDYNSSNSSQIFHSARNTTNQTFTVLKHSVDLIYNESIGCVGNDSTVFRNETVNLSVFVNDTNSTNPIANADCSLWVNNTFVNSVQTNSTGYCKFDFIPNQSFSTGKTNWKIGILNDNYYENENSTDLNLTIKEWISPEILNETNTTIYINTSTTFSAHLIDIYNSQANLSDYNCSFYLNGTEIGSNTTVSGVCSIFYLSNCSLGVGVKNLSVKINGTNEFYNISDNQTSRDVILKDRLNLSIISPTEGNYCKGQNITLNASAKNKCGNNTTVSINWYLVNKYKLNLTIEDTSGENRTNYPIILNGSFFSDGDFELTDWKLNYTNVSLNNVGVPFSVYPWTTANKDELNNSQEDMSNLTELVFLINLNASETKTFEIDLRRENPNTYNVSYNILNSGFDSGDFSFWEDSTTGSENYSTVKISERNNLTFANLSVRDETVNLTQELSNLSYTNTIQIKYKAWGEFIGVAPGEFYVSFGGTVYNLTPTTANNYTEPENWTTANCTNIAFNSTRSISIILTDDGDSMRTYALIDYVCFLDESRECVNFHSGKNFSVNLTSRKN